MERDKRWEKVRASIGEVPISGHDIETGYYKTLEQFIQVEIVVDYDGIQYHSKQFIEKDSVEEFQLYIWPVLLGKMAQYIDNIMEEVACERAMEAP